MKGQFDGATLVVSVLALKDDKALQNTKWMVTGIGSGSTAAALNTMPSKMKTKAAAFSLMIVLLRVMADANGPPEHGVTRR
jgi:hypothetical protein